MRLHLSFVFVAALVGCGGAPPPPAAAPSEPPKPEPVVVGKPQPAPVVQPVAAAEPTPEPAAEPAPTPPPAEPKEWKGKLLTKPNKGTFQVELGTQPNVGDSVELLRQVDASVPLVGGSWLAIADAEVTKVDGKKVTLKMQREKSSMKINGKKLDHFTPGVPVRVKPAAAEN